MLHRNSQKRIFVQNGIYAVVIVTKDRLPFFKEEICCQILFNVIDICKQFHKFELYGMVILFDHIHFLIKPISCDISKLIWFIKRHFTKEVNIIIRNNFDKRYGVEGGHRDARLQNRFKGLTYNQKQAILWMEEKTKDYQFIYNKKYIQPFYPKFKWQESFRDL